MEDTEKNETFSEPEGKKTEKKKGRLSKWWQAHKPTRRRIVQVYVALLTNANIKGFVTGRIYKGATKNLCVPGLNCYSCPGAVGACPLGALQNAFAASGTRTPVFVLGILLLFGLIFARTVCGWLCPVGLGQELLYKIKTPKLKKNNFTRILSYLKYVLLTVFVVAIPLLYGVGAGTPLPAFCKYICPAGTLGGAIGLLVNPNNADLYPMLGGLFTWKFAVMVAVIVACIFIFRAFCRFLCPLGALYGFFNKIALLGVKLDKNKCTDCGLCVSHCKMDIKKVGDHECINCGECIDVCPAKAITWKGSKLFLHANAVSSPAPEAAPLGAMLAGNAVSQETVSQETVLQETAASSEAVNQVPKPKKRRGKAFWLRICAWGAAAVVLVGALVYYNFIDKTPEVKDRYEKGDVCYDITLETYGGRGTFRLSEHRGRIVVLNFWYTTCTPCLAELPDFERIAEDYAESADVIAIHSAFLTEDVQTFLDNRPDAAHAGDTWSDFTLTFAQDVGEGLTDSETFARLGGKDSYPVTVVIDGEGVIREVRQGSTDYNALKIIIDLLLLE